MTGVQPGHLLQLSADQREEATELGAQPIELRAALPSAEHCWRMRCSRQAPPVSKATMPLASDLKCALWGRGLQSPWRRHFMVLSSSPTADGGMAEHNVCRQSSNRRLLRRGLSGSV